MPGKLIYTAVFYRLSGFFFLCFLLIQGVSATTPTSYYINLSGSDSNPGSILKPFRTIAKINSLILKANTIIYLQGGAVFRGPLILETSDSATRGQPIVITSYGKGIATVDGDLKEAVIVKSRHFILRNINVKGVGRKEGNTTNGIYISSSGFGVVENVSATGFQKSGIKVSNSSHILLNKVTATDNGFCGIYISGTTSLSKHIVISNCRADNNPGDPTNLTNHSGNGILVGGSDSVLIDHCTATGNGWDMPRKGNGPVGIWAYESDHLTIQYCISYKNKTHPGASDGGGFDFDGGMRNSVIQYCLSYENQGSGYGLFQYKGAGVWSGNTIRYCISLNDGQATAGAAGILNWNESADASQFYNCYVYNNIIYNSNAPAIRFDTNSANKNLVFANNIIIGKDEIITGVSSGEIFTGNTWWHTPGEPISFRGFKTLEDWATKTGQEKLRGIIVGKQTDPLLSGPLVTGTTDPYKLRSLTAFKLKTTSPLKNAGVDLKLLYNITVPKKDFFGELIYGSKTVPGVSESRTR